MVRNWLQRVMYGRYGSDQLSIFLLVAYFALYLISAVTGLGFIYYISLALIVYSIFRTMSRNIEKRRRENAKFLKLAGPTLQWWKMRSTMRRDKAHRYFKCPNCKQYLRVPKGKGKISITCRSCGTSFEEKS